MCDIYTPNFENDDSNEYTPDAPKFDAEVYFIASELGLTYDEDVLQIAIEAAKMGDLEPFSDGLDEEDTDDDFEIL